MMLVLLSIVNCRCLSLLLLSIILGGQLGIPVLIGTRWEIIWSNLLLRCKGDSFLDHAVHVGKLLWHNLILYSSSSCLSDLAV